MIGGGMGGPANDAGEVDSGFVEAPFGASKASGAGSIEGGAWSIIAGENDQGGLIDAEIFEAGEEASELSIHLAENGLEVCWGIAFGEASFGDPRGMDIVWPELNEARLGVISAEEIEGLVDKKSGAIPAFDFWTGVIGG